VLSYITIISFLSINISKQLFHCLLKHGNIKASLVFPWFLQNKTEGNAGMTQLIGNSSHVPEPWLKLQFSHDLQIVANIWDIVSTQVNKIYNTGLVVFGYFTAKFLHIAPLTKRTLLLFTQRT